MKLDTPFYRLPLQYDAERLAMEVNQFTEADWRPHPEGHKGNTALPLVAVGGDPANDGVLGSMRPTPHLVRCPYLAQVLASLGAVLGRTRLMRIIGHGEATLHVDTNYYWMHHVRVHVPVLTMPGVQFHCGGESVHMKAGECWIFDTWRLHNVINPADASRIHLVVDTVGSAEFWDLLQGAERPFDPQPEPALPPRSVPFQPGKAVQLACEGFNFPVVMSPWEQECMIADLIEPFLQETDEEKAADVAEMQALLVRFNRHWRALWARYADSEPGWPAYVEGLEIMKKALAAWQGRLVLPNKVDLVEALMQGIIRSAHNPNLYDGSKKPAVAQVQEMEMAARPSLQPVAAVSPPTFQRPVIIVAAPRSGSSLLFETLARSPDLWTVGGESHELIESVASLNPANRGFDSNCLTAADATPEAGNAVRNNFLARLRDSEGRPLTPGQPFRLLEKTPKNALRIGFLNALFPDALFIYLQREPRDNISSIIDAWRSGRFVTYPSLPGWQGMPWSLLLVPGWRELNGKALEEIAAGQWRTTHEHILADLACLPRERWTCVSHEEFLAKPRETMERLASFAGVRWVDPLDKPLPHSRHTLTPPDPNKWQRNSAELGRVLPGIEEMARKIGEVAEGGSLPAEPKSPPDEPLPAALKPSPKDEPLLSVSTSNLASLLSSLKISLAVSTYQAGKLILVRVDDDKVNTHFRSMAMPMGIALHRGRLAIGAGMHVWQFQNQPEVGHKQEPVGKHDACFLPRTCRWTGEIRVHEVAFAAPSHSSNRRDAKKEAELWIVNTSFSCLCTLDDEYSFVPRWRPKFVTALAPEDRCHLNGLGMRDGRPRYVTCLGATDTAGGWRENKRNGGLLIDITTGKEILTGLSMPHSPRWHLDRLWVMESGEGGIGYVDTATGKLHTVTRLPGFTRGVDFYGPYAFIGLSQVRESAVFSGLPITDRLPESERACGVWVVDLRDGKTVAFLRFESGVQEIFAVQVLPGIRFPELLIDEDKTLATSFILPDAALADVPGHAPLPKPQPAPKPRHEKRLARRKQ